MKRLVKNLFLAALAMSGVAYAQAPTAAQVNAYPDKAVTLVIPFAVGGPPMWWHA